MPVRPNAILPFILLLAALPLAAEETAAATPAETEQAILELTNAERKKAGLAPLKINPNLAKAARAHSANMARMGDLTHERLQARVAEAGYEYLAIGENVAWNQDSAADVLKSWMQSPGHRENILNGTYTEIGIGIARGAKGDPYYTQIFGRPGEAGTTAAAKFSIKNNTTRDVALGWTGSPAKPLEPGAKKTYSVSGVGELPAFRVVIDGRSQDLKYENGASYSIEETEKGIEVKNASPTEGAR